MKTIKIYVTDAEYAELMSKVNFVKADCEKHYRGYLRKTKTFIAMCARLNLLHNVERFAKAVKMK
jgi:hypothetical protein